jgi:hypothetical protein
VSRTTERGYGYVHQERRKWWAVHVEQGEVNCARCGKPIYPKVWEYRCPACGKKTCGWDLGHDDTDRTLYTGPEHACCNRATRTHEAERRHRTRIHSRDW